MKFMASIRYIKYLLAIPLLFSCKKDFLERKATNTVPADKIWKDPALAKLYLNNMYADIPGFDLHLYDNIADESRSFWGGAPQNILQGQWFPDNNPMDIWDQSYASIRKTNDLLANIDGSSVADADKQSMKGQAKFLRAKLYFDLVKRYGAVPVITVPQSLTDDLLVKQEPADKCFQFIIAELKEAITLLPETYGSRAVDVGRANKYSANAFLGRVLLYYASTLYNPSNDLGRWSETAAVNKAVIDGNKYSLHNSFRRLMLDKNNQEEIFSVQFLKPSRQHGWDSWNKPLSQAKQQAVRRSPIQEFVDAFEMKNGKNINDPASGYDPADPYINRDPRFDATVVYNGVALSGEPIYMYIGANNSINIPYSTITGYLFRKGINETNPDYYANSGSDQNWLELRFAEVLLNYAEAQNEAVGPDNSVYIALEKIRQRAGLDPYQLTPGLTQVQMREVIRHERYIELSFENKRYWDLRRWKIAKEKMDGKQYNAMYITKNGNGTYSYERKPVDLIPCVFQDKMYYLPIPQREIEKNPNLVQNKDW